MDEEQKRQVLANLLQFPQEKILEFILKEEFTFEELQQSGNFTRDKQEWVKDELDKEKRKHEIEKQFWEDCLETNTLVSLNEYIYAYPSGDYTNLAHAKIKSKEQELINGRDFHYAQMQKYPYYTKEQVQNLLDNKGILSEDLISKGIFTKKALNSFLNPPPFLKNINFDWKDLPLLPEDHTDVYFVGMVEDSKRN